MSELGFISSNTEEQLQNFYVKFSAGSPVNESFLINLIGNTEISPNLFVILEKIAGLYREKKRMGTAFKIFKRLSLYSDKYLGNVIDCALFEGELYLAELAGKKYLNYLVRKKNFRIGLRIIDDLIKAGIGKEYINNYRLIFAILNGDVKTFEKISGNLKNDFSNYDTYRMILSVLNFKKGKDKKWEELKEYKKFVLLKLFFWIKDIDPDNISNRKEFFNHLFEFKCFYPEDNFGLILLSKYARFYNCEALKSAVNEYLQNNKKKITKDEYFRAIEKVGAYRKELGPSEFNKSEKDEGRMSSLSRKILEIGVTQDKEFFINEKCLIKVCDLLDEALLTEFYKDLTICFLTMGFFEVAHSILNKIEKDLSNFNLEEKINHEYLRINLLISEKKFWEASLRANNLLSAFPLVPDEEKCFLYLKAEAQFFLGRKQEAKEIYLKIKKSSPNYRLVENRLLEIEINK